MIPSRGRSSGFTLVEVLISLVIGIVIVGGMMVVTDGSRRLSEENDSRVSLDTDLARSSADIKRVLLGVSGPTLAAPPPAPNWTEELTFSTVTGFTAGAVTTSPTQVLRREMAPNEIRNGADDDGDGLVDEGVLVWIQDEGQLEEQRRVLARDVSLLLEGEVVNGVDDNGNGLIDESGACFEQDADGSLVFRLTLERTAGTDDPVRSTGDLRVVVRNDG